MSSAEKIIELRQLLAEKFPGTPLKRGDALPTGIPRLDELLDGGLWRGALTELAAPARSCGSALCIVTLLHTLAAAGRWMALIDGADTFDPQPIDNATLARLLWVRCADTRQAMRAADLLARDGNLPLIVLDLRDNEHLHKIPGAQWYRLQRLVEQHDTTLLAITPRLMVQSAHARLTLETRLTLGDLDQTQQQLLDHLQLHLARRRFLEKHATG